MNQSHYLKVFVLAGLFMATHAGVSWANDAETPFSKKEYIKKNWDSFTDEQKATIRERLSHVNDRQNKQEYIKEHWDSFTEEQKAKIREHGENQKQYGHFDSGGQRPGPNPILSSD